MKKLICASLIALTTASAFAGAPAKKVTNKAAKKSAISSSDFYVRADVGAFIPTKKLNNGPYDKKLDNTASFDVGVGYKFNKDFRTDVTLAYRDLDYKKDESVAALSHLGSNKYKQTIKNYSLMLNGYYDIDMGSMFTPYVTAGIGLSKFNTKDLKFTNVIPGGSTNFKGKNTNNFAWNVGLGAKYSLNNNVDINLGYKYLDLGKVKIESLKGISGASNKIKAHEVALGLIYNF